MRTLRDANDPLHESLESYNLAMTRPDSSISAFARSLNSLRRIFPDCASRG